MTETLILSWNTGQTDFPVDVIEGLAKDSEADVIVLPEHFGPVATGELGDWAGLNGFQILSYEGSTSSVLVSERLGPYSVDTEKAPPWARFLAIAEFSSSPRLVIAHLEHARLWSAGLWNEHLGWAGLGWVAAECEQGNVVGVGDFNATHENLRTGDCLEGAGSLDATGAGTWPAYLPPCC